MVLHGTADRPSDPGILVLYLATTQIISPALALTAVAGMFFCHGGWGNITLAAEGFPKNAIATVTGFGGALGSWMGALATLTTGYVVGIWG